ncbi:MAG: YjfI family protein [Oleiphilaceae bacterium]|nr:YjfI family protein [Oleiphilaceae bacterium]
MGNTSDAWTTQSLAESLLQAPFCQAGQATIEVVDGVEPSILVTMREFGDLPVYMTVSGNQIIAEALLWSVDDVNDVSAFNDAILRTHKYFPLSTISLDNIGGKDYYHMFGALSATSKLENVVLEIETLASNVIQATEAYGDFLSFASAAS